ncbi:aminotransferase class V-fold PLP-dependent enzyme [Parapedobacter sp. 2B3]|uniref:aminotransferase class V-fold PLP-dependent enzyme n=1 Tax=Parapedobacter sp. 2B3 TaxID=3342381 RepID=UPI0035B59318
MEGELHKEEVNRLRAETNGCARRLHFNNAGASLPPNVVVDTVVDYLREESLIGGYETETKYHDRINRVYEGIAQLINASHEEIALFENASAAWGTAFKGLGFEEGDEIITSEMEYVTNLIGLVDIQKVANLKIKVVANDNKGNFSVEELEKAITARTKLIAVTHVASSGGSVLPVEQIGEVAERQGILYLLDACQSVGQMPLDVKQIKCDMLSATGRKYLRAPRGTGFLYVRKSSLERLKPVLMDFVSAGNVSLTGYTLRPDARRFELYEKSRALTLGLGRAVEYALDIGIDRIWGRIKHLSQVLRYRLSGTPGIAVHDTGDRLSGIVTFSVEGIESSVIKTELEMRCINVSVGGAQATPIYMEKNGITAMVRASVHYYNTEGEIDLLCRELSAIIDQHGSR